MSAPTNGEAKCDPEGNRFKGHTNLAASCNCSKEKEAKGGREWTPKVRKILKKSLAVLLVNVRMEGGQETAEKLLEVVHDEYFDLTDFQQNVKNMDTCEEITRNILAEK